MRKPLLHHERRSGQDAMTPMIDVVFLLLIFFIVASAAQIRESVLATDLSSAGAVESPAEVVEESWVVEIDIDLVRTPEGTTRMQMNGATFDGVAELTEQLAALGSISAESPVTLNPGPNVPMGDLISVYDACLSAGFHTIRFTAPKGGDAA